MGTSKDNLIEKIDKLEKQLKIAESHTYVYDTTQISVSDGELYIWYGDDNKYITIDVNSIYNDLPFIVEQVCKEHKKQSKDTLDRIKNSLNEIQ